jgi:hydrogenase maturation protease
MSARILVAGVGNIFFGDDAFGVEVVRRLSATLLPPGVEVTDYGIRGLHLSYALLDPPELLIAVDALPRGEPPGTLFVLEPELSAEWSVSGAEPHGMHLPLVFAQTRAMGGTLPRILIVGCEPADVSERFEISAAVQAAIDPAVALVRELLDRALSGTAATAARGT